MIFIYFLKGICSKLLCLPHPHPATLTDKIHRYLHWTLFVFVFLGHGALHSQEIYHNYKTYSSLASPQPTFQTSPRQSFLRNLLPPALPGQEWTSSTHPSMGRAATHSHPSKPLKNFILTETWARLTFF